MNGQIKKKKERKRRPQRREEPNYKNFIVMTIKMRDTLQKWESRISTFGYLASRGGEEGEGGGQKSVASGDKREFQVETKKKNERKKKRKGETRIWHPDCKRSQS